MSVAQPAPSGAWPRLFCYPRPAIEPDRQPTRAETAMVDESSSREPPSEAGHLAFRALFERSHGPLMGFFLKRGCSEVESEDLVQETLLNAYRGFDRFRREASDTTWIFSIAGNVWLNHLRSRRTQKRAAAAVSLDPSAEAELVESADRPPEISVLDRMLEDERRDQLRSAIRDLPEGRRNALQLRIVHGMKYRDIARLLKVEVNTVKSQIFQAKKQLEEKLGAALQSVSGGKAGR